MGLYAYFPQVRARLGWVREKRAPPPLASGLAAVDVAIRFEAYCDETFECVRPGSLLRECT